jgi:hypothetical protein
MTIGRPPVAVISHAYWTQRFGADPHVIGKTIALKDLVFTIVGVTGPDYFGRQTAGEGAALTLPMMWHATLGLKDHLTFVLLGRLLPGVTPDVARAELDALYQRALADERAAATQAGSSAPSASHVELQPATRGDFDNQRFAREVWILQIVAGLVLLLAAVNVASLQLARGAGRQRELATRLAFGATRARLVRQLVAESLVVSAAGGLLGLGLASWGADGLLALTGGRGSVAAAIVQATSVAFTLALIVLAAMLCGIAPRGLICRRRRRATLLRRGRPAAARGARLRTRRYATVPAGRGDQSGDGGSLFRWNRRSRTDAGIRGRPPRDHWRRQQHALRSA